MIGMELIDEDGRPLATDRVANMFEGIKVSYRSTMAFAHSVINLLIQDRGVLIGKGGINGNCFRIKPPMCITKKDADTCVSAIAEALKHGK